MTRNNDSITLRINRRELATILAALRFHQDENLQGGQRIPDQFIKEIATDSSLVKHLSFREVGELCERLNIGEDATFVKGLVIDPPHREGGDEPLFRVVYIIDVNATGPLAAARQVHRIMTDPESQPPVLDVLNDRGMVVSIDLSEEAPD